MPTCKGLMGMACLLVFIFLCMVCLCQSDDKLTPAKPLLPSDVLVSDGGVFALGFFSLKNSTSSSYVGIWYNNIPERTYVWIANRDNPITTDLPGKLVFTNSSDLVLLDSTGRTLWTTTNNITAGGGGTAAILLNSGNLVVRSPNGTGIWESFHYPTDTIVPNVSFSLSSADGAKRLVAWKGPDDPSSSDFSMGGDSSSDLQIVVWNGTRPYWRRAAWGGNLVFGTFQSNTSFMMYQTIVDTGDGYYIKLTVSDGSPSIRLTLDYTGMVSFRRWNDNTSSWTIFNQFPSPACDRYDSCGPFGYCDGTESVRTCKCLNGFEPNGLNFSLGCRRKEELKCGEVDSFLTLPDMKTPDKFVYIRNKSFDQCTAECSHNCSCTAYAYANLKNVDTMLDRSRCLVWMGELVDMEKFSNDFGENLYLRLPSSPVSKKKSTLLKIILPVMASLLLLPTCIWFVYKSRGKYQSKKIQYNHTLQHLDASNELGNENLEFPSVCLLDIITATNNFSDYNMLGKGGFGKVYRGILEGGKDVAIKRLSKGSVQGVEEFRNEVVLIAKLQHRNLVRLLGYCIHEDEKLLIYEYLPNKSLDAFLFDATRKSVLDWPTRFKIIKGVARGLLYLHQDSRLTIIHRDLKASNILLDTEMSPKISDFGMARIFGGNEQQANTTRVVGTYGYMSPEYAMEGSFSVKSDTYSFGVLLLEIAWSLWKDGNARELVDSSVVESCSLHEVIRCIHLGLLCVQDHPNARPLMSSVVFMLENETAPLPTPKQPVYFTLRNYETDQSNEHMRRSLNNMSITTLEGR
ncbi:putative G-type lectin S-receptor-like serine/threonine-protein kinase At1g61610 isoform X2 [Phragmites australis]|uniref:putative G-type lectin S-receptor-like serine/threonine-protein kinase At1g61610 isoform X2 n=1 Tax=Phragmites australis TaxID=29695 RepID=UPI002D77534C|nr:putative G-type lectin S-receptor-like serine/threonine-protein kinase At1g61610 isoform X2 [Phragmites australis]